MKISYTHAVFPKGKDGIVRFTLHSVSFAVLQIKELCSDEGNLTGLLWVIEYLRKPQKGFFINPKRESLRDSLVDYQVLIKKDNDYVLDPVVAHVIQALDEQNDLYMRAFKLIQNLNSNDYASFSEDDEKPAPTDRFESFADSLSLELDFWDQDSNKYSNPDKVPDSVLKIKVGRSTYNFLKSLEW
jgi:hypothetical protein